MAQNFSKIKGLKELKAKLKKYQSSLYDTISDALMVAGGAVEASAIIKSPIDTGNLRGNISHWISTNKSNNGWISNGGNNPGYVAVDIGTPVSYAIFHEFGTGIHAEDGNGRKTPWVYKDYKGQWHYTQGIAPHPFLRPALEENRENIKAILSERIKKGFVIK